jgi:hypothetical protein
MFLSFLVVLPFDRFFLRGKLQPTLPGNQSIISTFLHAAGNNNNNNNNRFFSSCLFVSNDD